MGIRPRQCSFRWYGEGKGGGRRRGGSRRRRRPREGRRGRGGRIKRGDRGWAPGGSDAAGGGQAEAAAVRPPSCAGYCMRVGAGGGGVEFGSSAVEIGRAHV